ncbi:MAG: ribosome maturation factor RimM [Pseudomonadota bacterium]
MPASEPAAEAEEVALGRIIGIFGVRGEVRLLLFNPDSDWLFERPRPVVIRSPAGEAREVRLAVRPGAGKRVLGAIPGVTDRDGARALMGWDIVVPRGALPAPEPGEWYVEDLLGTPARTTEGRDLGVLREIHPGNPVDVWEFSGPGGTTWLPALAENLVEVAAEGIVARHEGVLEAD